MTYIGQHGKTPVAGLSPSQGWRRYRCTDNVQAGRVQVRQPVLLLCRGLAVEKHIVQACFERLRLLARRPLAYPVQDALQTMHGSNSKPARTQWLPLLAKFHVLYW